VSRAITRLADRGIVPWRTTAAPDSPVVSVRVRRRSEPARRWARERALAAEKYANLDIRCRLHGRSFTSVDVLV